MSIESVVNWANGLKKNLWWLHALRLAAEKGELVRDDHDLLFKIAKMEHGLEEKIESYSEHISPLNLTGFGEEKNAVNLKSISKVAHVSALVSESVLEFSPTGLTAVYGDNGSGKSSYSKILKNACLTRGGTPKILSNIYGEIKGEPSAQINIIINDTNQEVDWKLSSKAHEDLKSIRIFDNTSATHYISSEDSIEFKPAGMKLLSQLMLACDFVKNNCDTESKPHTIAKNLPLFRTGCAASIFISSLSENTSSESIDALCINKEQEGSIQKLNEELIKLKSSTPEQLRKGYQERCKILQPLLDHFLRLKEELSSESLQKINSVYKDYLTKKNAAEMIRSEFLDGHEIKGICSPEWKLMWEHVKSYVEHHNPELAFPPSEGDPCPACLQLITGSSARKMRNFNDYLINKSEVDAVNAKKNFDVMIARVKQLSFKLKPYDFALDSIREHNADYAESIINLNSILEEIYNKLTKAEPEIDNLKVEFNELEWMSAQIKSWKEKEILVATNEGLDKEISDLSLLIQDLEDRKLFSSARETILAEIERFKKLSLYNKVIGSCQTILITNLTNSIAKSGALGRLQETFREELKRLGFNNFDVDTQTRGLRGKQMLKLHMPGKGHGILEIASEGEQKCVALASFFAELILDNRKSAIIFDDPINSLDHKWRRKFANRITQESLFRQVIVFTHDMPFLKMLEEASDIARSEIKIVSIAKYGKSAGFTYSEPPWDAKNTVSRIGVLKNSLPELKRLEMSGSPEYEYKAKHTYNLMRETWERLVEEWLLRKIVERFAREVRTQSIRVIVDNITSADNDIINAAMSKCSTFMYGHDNANGLSVDCPCYDEVEKDVMSLEAYFKDLKKRRP